MKLTHSAVQPYGNMVLISPKKRDEKIGQIYLPQNMQEQTPSCGTVVEVGPGRPQGDGTWLQPNVAPGDIVHFRQFAAFPIKDPTIPDVDLLIINGDEIVAVQRAHSKTPYDDLDHVPSQVLTQEQAIEEFSHELQQI